MILPVVTTKRGLFPLNFAPTQNIKVTQKYWLWELLYTFTYMPLKTLIQLQ